MKHSIHLLMVLLIGILPCCIVADTNTTKRPHPGLAEPSNAAEQWLDGIKIAEVQFRAANMYDCLSFIQMHINEFATRNSRNAPRILYDVESIRYLSGNDTLLPTFTAKDISAFRLIKILEALGDLRFVVEPGVIVVEMKEMKSANQASQTIGSEASPQSGR